MAAEAEAADTCRPQRPHQQGGKVACSSCSQLVSDARPLPCQHFYCPECLYQLPKEHEDQVVCPRCDLPSKVADAGLIDLSNVSVIQNMLDFMHLTNLCCSFHHDSPLDRYCESCHTLVCVDCCDDFHSEHTHSKIDNCFSQIQSQRDTYQADVESEIHRVQEAIRSLKVMEEVVVTQGECVKEEVANSKEKIFNLLNKAEQRVKRDVDQAIQHKISILKQQITNAEDTISRLEECVNAFRSNSMTVSAQQFLLKESQTIRRTSSIVHSVKKKSFEPLEHDSLQFSWEKLEEGIKKNFTSITCQFHPSSVQLIGFGEAKIPVMGKKVEIAFAFTPLSCGRIPLESISCLVFLIGKSQSWLPCEVKTTNNPYKFKVMCTPTSQGVHNLHVMVNNSLVQGSPFTFEVHPSPHTRISPLNTYQDLTAPCGVDVTGDGDIVVTELNSNCITVIDGGGRRVRSFCHREGGDLFGIACTTKGTVLVADGVSHEVLQYTMDGRCVCSVGGEGLSCGQFRKPMGIAVNKVTNEVYVADTNNHRIQILDENLAFSKMFGSKGSDVGQLDEPWGLAFDSDQLLYVADSKNHRVQKFTPGGEFLFAFGEKGYGKGKLMTPAGIAVDGNNFVYVSDFKNHYISVFDSNGVFVHLIGDTGSGSNIFCCPCQLAFDQMSLYVCDLGKNRICVV